MWKGLIKIFYIEIKEVVIFINWFFLKEYLKNKFEEE